MHYYQSLVEIWNNGAVCGKKERVCHESKDVHDQPHVAMVSADNVVYRSHFPNDPSFFHRRCLSPAGVALLEGLR